MAREQMRMLDYIYPEEEQRFFTNRRRHL